MQCEDQQGQGDEPLLAIHREREAGRETFLDCRRSVGAVFPERFPAVFGACMAAGIDPRTELIPVAPAAHYHMGGIVTDIWGRSTVPGLSACGECASTGAHGANRLASNSLLESAVFAARIAQRLFRFSTGEQPYELNKVFARMLTDADLLEDANGQRRTLYSLRHTYATLELHS